MAILSKMSFETSIQKWVTLDNQIKTVGDHLKDLRTERNDIGDNIITYVETNNLNNVVVKISDGKLRFGVTRNTAPLTLRHVELCLNKCISDGEKVGAIMKYIKDTRDVKEITDIKRTYAKD